MADNECIWTYDDIDGKWDTECGEAHVFLVGGPEENKAKYCCYCGGLLRGK